jgi:tetratricopeptide (TPR) repeat protein
MVLGATDGAATTLLYYWGEAGQYGPFDVQATGEWAGWPDFGQVLRYFRKKAKMSAKTFGELYGKATNADRSAVCERWIQKMELDNQVPVDMNRRKLIARLLNIPPMLFGLAVLEDITLEPQTQAPIAAAGQTRLPKIAADTTKYKNNIYTLWQLHETSNAQDSIGQLEADLGDLESLEQQTQGDLRYHVQELLLSDQILATHIVRDQRQFSRAHYHANEAVRVAKGMDDSDLMATALFTRGWTRLEWGMFGTMEQGVFQVQQDKLKAAVRDFQEALNLFPAQNDKESMHPQLLGNLIMYVSRAQAALAVSRGERMPAPALVAIDDVVDTVDKQNIDDPYTRVLVRGQRRSWRKASYMLSRTSAFNIAGLPGQALKELNAFERQEKIFGRDETRQLAWLDILKANVYMGLEEFGSATEHATQALLACQDIHSVTNTAIITDIYGRLLTSRYKASSDVKELGDILRESPVRFIESLDERT